MSPLPHPGPLHLGALHPVEQVLTFVLAFGPFVVLALVLRHQRRTRDRGARGTQDRDEAGSSRPRRASN